MRTTARQAQPSPLRVGGLGICTGRTFTAAQVDGCREAVRPHWGLAQSLSGLIHIHAIPALSRTFQKVPI